MNGAPIVVDEPVVSYCETAMGEMEAGKTVMGKSANKHNKLYVWGGHLTEELVEAIDPVAGDAPTVGAMDDMMQRSKFCRRSTDGIRMTRRKSGLLAQRPRC